MFPLAVQSQYCPLFYRWKTVFWKRRNRDGAESAKEQYYSACDGRVETIPSLRSPSLLRRISRDSTPSTPLRAPRRLVDTKTIIIRFRGTRRRPKRSRENGKNGHATIGFREKNTKQNLKKKQESHAFFTGVKTWWRRRRGHDHAELFECDDVVIDRTFRLFRCGGDYRRGKRKGRHWFSRLKNVFCDHQCCIIIIIIVICACVTRRVVGRSLCHGAKWFLCILGIPFRQRVWSDSPEKRKRKKNH